MKSQTTLNYYELEELGFVNNYEECPYFFSKQVNKSTLFIIKELRSWEVFFRVKKITTENPNYFTGIGVSFNIFSMEHLTFIISSFSSNLDYIEPFLSFVEENRFYYSFEFDSIRNCLNEIFSYKVENEITNQSHTTVNKRIIINLNDDSGGMSIYCNTSYLTT